MSERQKCAGARMFQRGWELFVQECACGVSSALVNLARDSHTEGTLKPVGRTVVSLRTSCPCIGLGMRYHHVFSRSCVLRCAEAL